MSGTEKSKMKEFSSNHPWCLFRGTSKSHLGEKGRTIIFQKCWLLVGYVAFRPTILSFARRPFCWLVVAKSPPCGGTRRFRRFRFFLFEVSKPIGMVNALQLMRCSPAGFLPSTVSDQNRNEAALFSLQASWCIDGHLTRGQWTLELGDTG